MVKSSVIESLPTCPIELTVSIIASRWKLLVVRNLLVGPQRNSDLLHSLPGISQKVLTSTLKDLANTGFVHREVYPEVPPRVEYSLTKLGYSLLPLIISLKTWGENYQRHFDLPSETLEANDQYIDMIAKGLQNKTGLEVTDFIQQDSAKQNQVILQVLDQLAADAVDDPRLPFPKLS